MANESNLTVDIAATFKALYGFAPVVIPSLGSELAAVYPVGSNKDKVNASPNSPAAANPYNVSQTAAQRYRQPQGGLTPLTDQGITDMIGRPVFMPITLLVNDPFLGATSYVFPFSLLTIKNKKIIKETPMVERGGSVIEEIGLGPWEIEIKGFLIDGNNEFPDDQLISLYQLYVANQVTNTIVTVQLKCAISDIFLGANPNVVITEIEIPPKAKVIGVRDFSMKMIQDSILVLYPSSTQSTAVDPAIQLAKQ